MTASLMLRKLGTYPRRNGLAVALRELGRIERTRFALDQGVFLSSLGELRDYGFEAQRYRARGLNLVVAASVLWNTIYLGRAVQALRAQGAVVADDLLPHLSPLG